MAEYTFYTHPQSRGWIAWWALNEVAADFEPHVIDWNNKPAALIEANPLGKIPTVIHHTSSSNQVVTETAAICHYLAETHPAAGLLPTDSERADYFRLLFYLAGPVEQALIADAMGWKDDTGQREGMLGFGNYTRAMDTFEHLLARYEYACGDRFTMADVYVGSQIDWGLRFGTLPDRDVFKSYVGRLRTRESYRTTQEQAARYTQP